MGGIRGRWGVKPRWRDETFGAMARSKGSGWRHGPMRKSSLKPRDICPKAVKREMIRFNEPIDTRQLT